MKTIITYQYMTTGDKTRISQIRTAGILTENYSYDGQSRVSVYDQTVDYRPAFTTSYLYDSLDRVTEVQYPAQLNHGSELRKTVTHNYDSASRLSSLTYGGTQQAGNIVYNAADQTTQIKIGASGANQVTEDYTFDAQTGLLTNQTATMGSTTLLDLSYDYGRNGSVGSLSGRTGHLTKIVNNLDTNKNRFYEFDALGRLTKAKGGSTGTLWNQSYTYDRYGNRTNVAAAGTAADSSPIPIDGIPNLTYDNASNRITTNGYQYDVAGNQIRSLAEDGTTWVLYEYDAANRIQLIKKDDKDQTLVQAFQYGSTNARLIDYDPLGTGRNTFYASVGGQVLAEYTEYAQNDPTWTKSYTYLGDTQLSTVTPSGSSGENIEYSHPDRLGAKVKTNQSTGTSSEQASLPFGTALNAESTLTNNTRRFTSYERSAPTGLDYAINRTYDSKLGRFTQVDPIDMGDVSLVNPQSFNLYSYCHNDPINYIDPSGLGFFSFLKKLFKWVMIAVAIVVAVALVLIATAFVTAVLFNATLPAFLGGSGLLGALSGVMGSIGSAFSFMAGAVGIEIGASAGSYLAGAIFFGIGAITNFARTKKPAKSSPCPPIIEDLISGRGWLPHGWFQNTINRALELANKNSTERPDSGRYKEVGGWILLRKDGQKAQAVIKSPEAEPTDTGTQVNLGEPRNHIKKLLNAGWLIVGDFHTHVNKISNPGDVQISEARKTPGVWIYPDGSTKVYGPSSGIFGKGIPAR